MRASKRHPFVAWLFDLYVFSYFIGGTVALFLALTGRPGTMLIAACTFLAALITSLVYHTAFASRVALLSPGERIAGRFPSEEDKIWLNPYSRTRWPLFICLLIPAIIAGNSWDGIGRGTSFVLAEVLLQLMVLTILALSMVLVGQGRPWAIIVVVAYTSYLAVASLLTPNDLPDFAVTSMAAFFGLISLMVLVVGLIFIRLRLPKSEPGVEIEP